ncbi:MAG: hypothetical protein JKY25_09140 [Robiginitomaculum sp.]|nr:hypothetical protein [Robiginitomaculum sp.]
MKLDLIAIEKLCPAGVTPLADLRAFVLVLVRVLELGIGGARDVKSYAHMLAQHSQELRTKTRSNLNLKIKAWVKQCPERTAWVRSVIGEAAIRSWVARLRTAYTAPKTVGNRREEKPDAKRRDKPRSYKPRTHKLFALVRLSEVEKLLPFRPRWPRNIRPAFSSDTGNLRHAARTANHLASLELSEKPHPARTPRPQKPIRFFPSELGVSVREPKIENPAQKYGEDPPLKKFDGPNQAHPDKHGIRPDNPRPEKPP